MIVVNKYQRFYAIVLLLAAVFIISSCASLKRAERYHQAGEYDREIIIITRLLSSVKDKREKPVLLLKRGRAYVESARKLRLERSPNPAMGGVFSWPGDTHKFREFYYLAALDFREIIKNHPLSAQTAEAQFMLGLIHDYPHLSSFDEALDAYRETIEKYPETDAAVKARERVIKIMRIKGVIEDTPYGKVP